MADYSSTNSGGRFGLRTPTPSTTSVKVKDRRSDQGPAVGRAEISEGHVAMPVSVTDDVVTKIETFVERVYTSSATIINGEVIENCGTTEAVQGSNGSALPRGLFTRQTLNNSKANSGTNEAVTNAWNKSIGGGAKDGANEWSRQATGGVANSTDISARTTLAGGALGASEPSRQIGGGAKDIGSNGWSGSTGGGINKSDAGATGSSKPIGGGNKDVGPNQSSRPGGGITKDVTPNRLSTPSGGAGAGGADSGTNRWSRPIDGVTDDIGPNGRRGLTGGTTNGVPTNESRPIDVINSTGTSNLNRPSAGTNNSGSGAWKPIGGTNNTGNDGRNQSSGGGPGAGGGTDTSTNNWSRPIDGSTANISPSGRKGLTGGTAYYMPINESRPSIGTIPSRGSSVGANNISARPVVGANNSSTGAWGNPIVGTNNSDNGRSWSGGTNYIGADWTSRPSVMIADEYNRLNRPAWGQPPTNDISTRRPTNYPGVAVETVKEPSKAPQPQVAWPWRGQLSPSSVTPATEPNTIDSNEAATKYNGIGFTAPRPQRKKVIDSREAAEKYKGVFINSMK